MLPSWPLNLPLSANVDTAKAQAWRFYGRQEAQDHAEPVVGATGQTPEAAQTPPGGPDELSEAGVWGASEQKVHFRFGW